MGTIERATEIAFVGTRMRSATLRIRLRMQAEECSQYHPRKRMGYTLESRFRGECLIHRTDLITSAEPIMTGIRRASVTALLFVATLFSLCASVRPQARRPMTPADILRIANVSDAQISPNGEWVVYVVSTIEGDQSVSTLWLVGGTLVNLSPARTSHRVLTD